MGRQAGPRRLLPGNRTSASLRQSGQVTSLFGQYQCHDTNQLSVSYGQTIY
jgi:hypothetical protein